MNIPNDQHVDAKQASRNVQKCVYEDDKINGHNCIIGRTI